MLRLDVISFSKTMSFLFFWFSKKKKKKKKKIGGEDAELYFFFSFDSFSDISCVFA
jgi:hypothetical protein